MKKKFFANLWLTFHSWSPRSYICIFIQIFPLSVFYLNYYTLNKNNC